MERRSRGLTLFPLFLLGFLWATQPVHAWEWEPSGSTDMTHSGAPPDFYVGPVLGASYLASDFDGSHVLFNKQTGETGAVPKFSPTVNYGGVAGVRIPLPKNHIDLGLEFGYREARLSGSSEPSVNAFN